MVKLIYPIVLVHGYFDSVDHTNTWSKAVRILEEKSGSETKPFRPHIPKFASIDDRTKDLIKQIQGKFPRQSGKTIYIHIWGHSMADKQDLGFKVLTVATFGTPHRGVKAIDDFPGAEAIRNLRKKCGDQAYSDLSATNMYKFNMNTPDVSSVRYFSWAGKCYTLPSDNPVVTLTSDRGLWNVTRWNGPTDGMVNVDSAIWTKEESDRQRTPGRATGTHLGTFLGVDHLNIPCYTETITKTLPHLDAAEYHDNRVSPIVPVTDTFDRLPSPVRTVVERVDSQVRTVAEYLPSPVRTVAEHLLSPVKTAINFPKEMGTNIRGTGRTMKNLATGVFGSMFGILASDDVIYGVTAAFARAERVDTSLLIRSVAIMRVPFDIGRESIPERVLRRKCEERKKERGGPANESSRTFFPKIRRESGTLRAKLVKSHLY
ncbi:hypothetical protein F5887DRAFT_921691 [Amanita rubescens]|nr:hypothetical protein F5887DRAFT_921691 [Amanita rubescens]